MKTLPRLRFLAVTLLLAGLFVAALRSADTGRTKERDFTKAAALAPDEASRMAYTARLYHAQGLPTRAMDAYRAALARDDLVVAPSPPRR